jgi:hypothetical protein
MLRLAALVPALFLAGAALAADEPAGLTQPLPAAATPAPVEETPGFQAVRPLPGNALPGNALPGNALPGNALSGNPAQPAAAPAEIVALPPAADPAPGPGASSDHASGWGDGLLVMAGGLVSGLIGLGTVLLIQRRNEDRQRRSVAATLAIEIESRRQAFETVPAPPNAEAGVSFVSAVSALAGLDCGWRAAQSGLYLLPDKLAGHLAVHYGAVQHVAEFVKGQSIAAALRMLQANRIGGHPCPDAGAMREAHVELAAAFRGIDKLILALKSLT